MTNKLISLVLSHLYTTHAVYPNWPTSPNEEELCQLIAKHSQEEPHQVLLELCVTMGLICKADNLFQLSPDGLAWLREQSYPSAAPDAGERSRWGLTTAIALVSIIVTVVIWWYNRF